MRAYADTLAAAARRRPATTHKHLTPGPSGVQRKAACACGGGCPHCRDKHIQPKLDPKVPVSQPHDASEREADHVAERAMQEPREAASVQRAATAPAALGDELAPSGGQPLEAATRADMEGRLGADFGAVRVHTGTSAARSAAGYDALAYTAGRNIVFGEGQYAPQSTAGRLLLAHELAHVMQQSAVSQTQVQRAPAPRGTAGLHEDVVEEYREAHGLPAHGIDPVTGQQVGPTDQEIRFGGLLAAWIEEKSGTIAAPTKTPKFASAGTGIGDEDVRAGCKRDNQGDENDYHFCRRHREFAVNVFPRAVENIGKVASPYNQAIAKLYGSAQAWVRLLAGATPSRGKSELDATGHPGTLQFGATSLKVPEFHLILDQQFSDTLAENRAYSAGIEIWINEMSPDILLYNFPAIESAMVHEAMHAFSKAVRDQNAERALPGAIGLPTQAPVDLNLDRSSYGSLQRDLENVTLPYVRQIQQLPSQKNTAPSAQFYAELTARIQIGETMARVEGAIYEKQRAGQSFGPGDLSALTDFYAFDAYWEPDPSVHGELINFLLANREKIRNDVGPVIREIGARYLSLRPRPIR